MSNSRNIVFVLTGPSGAGKSTYSNMLVKEIGDSCMHNITYTTRTPRNDETYSEYFKFINISEFRNLKEKGIFFVILNFVEVYMLIKRGIYFCR